MTTMLPWHSDSVVHAQVPIAMQQFLMYHMSTIKMNL